MRTVKGDWILVSMSRHRIYKLFNILTCKELRIADADFDEYSFPYTDRLESLKQPLLSTILKKRGHPVGRYSGGAAQAASHQDSVHSRGKVPVCSGEPLIHSERRALIEKAKLGLRSLVTAAVAEATCSSERSQGEGKPKCEVFSKSVLQLVSALKAVHLELETSGSLGIPSPSLETLTLAEAMNSEDALEWLDSIKEEISSLVKMNTFKIM